MPNTAMHQKSHNTYSSCKSHQYFITVDCCLLTRFEEAVHSNDAIVSECMLVGSKQTYCYLLLECQVQQHTKQLHASALDNCNLDCMVCMPAVHVHKGQHYIRAAWLLRTCYRQQFDIDSSMVQQGTLLTAVAHCNQTGEYFWACSM